MKTLDRCKAGECFALKKIVTKDKLLQSKLLSMGLIAGTKIKFISGSLLGDPIIVEVCGYRLCLRKKEAACIELVNQ